MHEQWWDIYDRSFIGIAGLVEERIAIMGMDITGICQERIDGRWVTASKKPRLFEGTRNRDYFIFLLGVMNHIDINDGAIDDLIRESDGYIDDKTELTDRGNNFSNPGFLTLSELIDLKQDRYNPSPWLHDELIRDLSKICGTRDHKDFRIVFIFDN